jgi:hypothetical protein
VPQLNKPQTTENTHQKPGDHRMMKGLQPDLVSVFLQPSRDDRVITTRGVARAEDCPETFVTTALIRDLYDWVRRHDKAIAHLETALSMPTVRDFRVIQGRRAA